MNWRNWITRRKREKELEAEIEAHLAIETRQRMDRGEPDEEAHLNAKRDFGNIGQIKEVTREVSGWRVLDRFEQDLRHAIQFTARTFRKEFSLSMVTILTLALAVGANTALFSWINALILKRPPGVGQPEDVVHLGKTTDGQGFDTSFSYPLFGEYRDASGVFSGISAYEEG